MSPWTWLIADDHGHLFQVTRPLLSSIFLIANNPIYLPLSLILFGHLLCINCVLECAVDVASLPWSILVNLHHLNVVEQRWATLTVLCWFAHDYRIRELVST